MAAESAVGMSCAMVESGRSRLRNSHQSWHWQLCLMASLLFLSFNLCELQLHNRCRVSLILRCFAPSSLSLSVQRQAWHTGAHSQEETRKKQRIENASSSGSTRGGGKH